MSLESLDPDRVENALIEYGALSVTLTDGGDEPVLEPAPGEMPLWTDTRVTALFDQGTDLHDLPRHLAASLDIDELPACSTETLADRPWEREWLKDFGPMRFGDKLWIVPGDLPNPADDAVVVRLDPGLAFGTGTHATTALCLAWLDSLDLAGKTVFDFGCGSGVLGIAALRLGAASVQAIDIDLQAVTATRQNAVRNDVDDRVEAGTALPAAGRRFDIVVANILAGTLIEHADLIIASTALGGQLALSGILSGQVDSVLAAFEEQVAFGPAVTMDGWAMLSGTRN
jgi:ribosomal protein L11 methyltransferase